ncbi:MAG: EAL domain-containing protein [Lachnospiraceae bacterium]
MELEQVIDKRQSIIKIIVSGIIILTVCMGLCMLHVGDERHFIYQLSEAAHFKELETAQQTFQHEVGKNLQIVEETAKNLSNLGSVPTDNMIQQTLHPQGLAGEFSYFCYVDDKGSVYYKGGHRDYFLTEDVLKQLQMQKADSYITLYTMKQEDPGKPRPNQNTNILFVAPVLTQKTVIGHIVAMQSIDLLFNASVYQNIIESGPCFMIHEDGTVFFASSENEIIKGSDYNLYEGLKRYSNQKEDSMDEINTLRKMMVRQDKVTGHITFKTSQGENTKVFFERMEMLPNAYFISCFDESLVTQGMHPLISRTILLCTLIFIAALTLIFIIWVSSKRSGDMIEKMAYEDAVTNGKNVNYFYKKALEIMAVNSETPFLIQRFDISHFRYLNESYGHSRADELLKGCIQLAEEHFYEKEVCVRMDSDQFLMLMENDGRVEPRRESYVEAVNEYARSIGIKYPIRFKFGIYQVRKHDKDMNVMIDRANLARKSLHGDEKELKAYYSDDLFAQVCKNDVIESEMQKAMEDGEFQVYLQPKWDIQLDKINGAEALVRWIRDGKVLAYPDEFIPLFEQNGFIEKLDFYMLETVCKRMRRALDIDEKVYPVSINQSRVLMYNPDYVNHIVKILNRYHIPEGYIELELTETIFFDDRDKMVTIMNQLKEHKITLLMDDFGSGYSSLNLLKDIPFDIMKIDREFFSETITSTTSTIILQKVAEMAAGLDIIVVCEGVETQEQVDKLKEIGIRYVQGYFYGRPIEMEEFIKQYGI